MFSHPTATALVTDSHLNQEGEHSQSYLVLDAEVHGHALDQITLLVFKHQHTWKFPATNIPLSINAKSLPS